MKMIIFGSLFLISFSALASNAKVACQDVTLRYSASCIKGFEMMKKKNSYAQVLTKKCIGPEFKKDGDVLACQEGAFQAVNLLTKYRYSYELEASINCLNSGVDKKHYPYCIDGYVSLKNGGLTTGLKSCREYLFNGQKRACETGLSLAL